MIKRLNFPKELIKITTLIILTIFLTIGLQSTKPVLAVVGEPCCPEAVAVQWYWDFFKPDTCYYEVGGTRTEQKVSCDLSQERCNYGHGFRGICVSLSPVVPTPHGITCGNLGQDCCPGSTLIARRSCLVGVPDKPFNPDCKCLTQLGDGTRTETGIDFGKISQELLKLENIDREKLKKFLPGPGSNLAGIISIILPYLFIIAGLLLLFYLIAGGFQMMIAAGDEKGLASAKGKITNALIGFLLLFISFWLVQIIEVILGIQIF